MSAKTDTDSLRATHPQRDVAVAHYYGQRRVVDTSDTLKPNGVDQSRLRKAYRAFVYLDEKGV